jgi:hypothetical protein
MLSREVKPHNVLAHFPLQVGNRWIYETRNLTGDPEKPHLDHWFWEVRITRRLQTPDGLIVFRQHRVLQVLQGTPGPSDRRAGPYLVKDGYVYELPERDWVESKRPGDDDASRKARAGLMEESRKESMKRLRAGEITPAFFFPMSVGLMWAEREREDVESQDWIHAQKAPNSFYHWDVIGQGGRGHCGCMNLPSSAFDILYFTVGGPSEFAFQDGVGVVGEWTRHQGTYWEETTTLKQFIPVSPSRASQSTSASRLGSAR